MKFWIVISMLIALFAIGCDKIQSLFGEKTDAPPVEAVDTETETEAADTETSKDDSNYNKLSSIAPIQVEGNELAEIAAALEAKRLELEQQKRDLIEREQMVTRLETEALSKRDELQALQHQTQTALDTAVSKIKQQYKQEHEKLVKHWEKIKVEHKEFISKYLSPNEDGEQRDTLEPELKRLQKERQQRIEQLIKTIEGMNPQSCALMITSMDQDDAVEVMSGLSSTKSAEILSNMVPDRAAVLAKGLMGPKVPSLSELEAYELPHQAAETDTDKEDAKK